MGLPMDEWECGICYNVHMETKVSGNSTYRTEYHIVWIPKYRRLPIHIFQKIIEKIFYDLCKFITIARRLKKRDKKGAKSNC
jgi:hypothetical protein